MLILPSIGRLIDRMLPGGTPVQVPAPEGDELGQVDLAFVVDTTGSMGAFLEAAKQQMVSMLEALTAASATPIRLRVGLVEYRDHPPQDSSFAFRAHGFHAELAAAEKAIRKLKPDGGGDGPESVFDGLIGALDALEWRPHSRRLAVLVGDAPPHGVGGAGDGFPRGCPCGSTIDSVTCRYEERGTILYALGLTRMVEPSFTSLARLTGGRYFAAGQGTAAIETIQKLLAGEFGALEFDGQVLALRRAEPEASVDALAEKLGGSRAGVSASLSRLGRRGLLDARKPAEADGDGAQAGHPGAAG